MVGFCRISEAAHGAGVGRPELQAGFGGEVVNPWVSGVELEMLEWRKSCEDEGGLKLQMIVGLAAGSIQRYSSQNYYAMKAFTMCKSNGQDSNFKNRQVQRLFLLAGFARFVKFLFGLDLETD